MRCKQLFTPNPPALVFLALVSLAVFASESKPQKPQQLVYQHMNRTETGEAVAILMPMVAISLGVKSKSGPTVITKGDVLNCKPFSLVENIPAADGKPYTLSQEMLNCGPIAPGGEDRILSVVGIEWPQ